MGDRLGVRGRLLLAFMGISALAVLAAGAAMYSFLKAGKTLDQIARDRVPATVASQQLARRAERIVALAPALLTVDTEQEHQAMSTRISAEFDAISSQFDSLRTLDVDPGTLRLIEDLVGRLRVNLNTVDTLLINNLVLAERRKELLRDLSFTDVSSRRLLEPGLLVRDAKLAELRAEVRSSWRGGAEPLDVEDLVDPVISLAVLQKARTEVSTINDLLLKVAAAGAESDVDVLVFPLRRSLAALADLIDDMKPDLAARLRPRLAQFEQLASGKDSIVRAHKLELQQLGAMHDLLDRNVNISNRLTEAVENLVYSANQDIQAATQDAFSVQRTSTVIMAAVVALSLICSVLIVWLYVGRSLIARLTGLSNSMLAIARGNLDAPIPTGGNDEISAMERALVVFRDTAVEVRETNLRELREARQRLTDAIEAIDGGFSLYDADERLVLCNSRYRDTYPGLQDIMVPGTPFETILRAAAERGLIKGVDGNVDEWVKDRLALYRTGEGPHIQEQADGRWLQIVESKTDDGGTVAIYSDITKLVEQSEELEAWNHQLEERVAAQVEELHKVEQLKRFFPPRLADAMVSGDQSEILQDHRREVTVVFCDLRGFTAFSSMAEPEEEMRVLREYHAVVCPLIFDYGATLEHFAGDGVMSFLNDPIEYPDHVHRAVEMAIAMRTGMDELRQLWLRREVDLGFGVGIGTGYATLGRIGTQRVFHYAAIGSVANLAARLCDEAKHDQILVTQRVYSEIERDFKVETVGDLSLKGFLKPVPAYNVLRT